MDHPSIGERPSLSRPSMQVQTGGTEGWGNAVLVMLFTIATIAFVFAVILIAGSQVPPALVQTPGLAGAGGAYGLYIETSNFIDTGAVNAIGGTCVSQGIACANGGGGLVVVTYNSVNGHYTSAAGTVNVGGGMATGTAGGVGSNVVNTISLSGYAIPIAVAGSAPACGTNPTGTAAIGCSGNVLYTQSVSLISSLNVTNDIVVPSGIILTTNGWNLVAGNAVIVQAGGQIITGTAPNYGAPGSGYAAGGTGTGTATSYGGAGAGGTGCIVYGGTGGTTLVAGGAGAAPSSSTGGLTCTAGSAGTAGKTVPALTAANTILYFATPSNTLAYATGAGGGGSSPLTSLGTVGSTGQTGISVFISLFSYVITLSNFVGIIILLAIIVIVVGVLYYFFRQREEVATEGSL